MKFVTYSELNNDIINSFEKIPHDIDLIVGIPRSGLFVANIIALYLNKPLADFDTYLAGAYFGVGNTKSKKGVVNNFDSIRRVLIVEDTVSSGRSIDSVKKRIEGKGYNHVLIYMAAYVFSNVKEKVDIYIKTIDEDRVFEWNYLHNSILSKACFDIDGVLCVDPTDIENDDGDNYIKFLMNAFPKLIPTRKIGHIVTSRLEKYRPQTEEWLSRHGIEYEHLHMMNLDSAQERRELGNHASFKAEIYGDIKSATWFVESDPNQALEISRLTGKLVFCTENQVCYSEGAKNRVKTQITQTVPHKIKAFGKKILPSAVLNIYRKAKGNIKS